MKETPNYGLPQIDQTDRFNIEDFNKAWLFTDLEIKKTRDEFDTKVDELDLSKEKLDAKCQEIDEAESVRTKDELTRKTSETKRVEDESIRITNETNRNITFNQKISQINELSDSIESQEAIRVRDEELRRDSETIRTRDENVRINKERERNSDESDRVNSEIIRKNDEIARVNSENTRRADETSRVNAETSRATTFNTLKTNMETATNTSITEEGKRATTFNTLKADMLNTEAQLKATDKEATTNEATRKAEWEVLKKEPTTARKDYFNKTHNTLQERLNSDFDNVHQRVNDSSLIEYSGTNITAKNSYYGLTKEHSIGGRTLQNLAKEKGGSFEFNPVPSNGFNANPVYKLKSDTIYTIIANFKSNTLDKGVKVALYTDNGTIYLTSYALGVTGITSRTISAPTGISRIRLYTDNTSAGSVSIDDFMILEGDHTNTPLSELPYFEGIASVGDLSKNIFDGNWIVGRTLDGTTGLESSQLNRNCTDFIEAKPSTSYSISGCSRKMFNCYDSNKVMLGNANSTMTTLPNTKYVRFSIDTTVDYSQAQLEQGTTATPYEPYYENYKINTRSCCKNVFDLSTPTIRTSGWGGTNVSKFADGFTFNTGQGWNSVGFQVNLAKSKTVTVSADVSFKTFSELKTKTQKFNIVNDTYGLTNAVTINEGEVKRVAVTITTKDFTNGNVFFFGTGYPEGASHLTTDLTWTIKNIQVEQGTTPTPYTPYVEDTKTYYLSEPLRSLPNGTKDEIVGSQEIRRVGKRVLNGNEGWFGSTEQSNTFRIAVPFPQKSGTHPICDKILVRSPQMAHGDYEYLYMTSTHLFINYNSTKVGIVLTDENSVKVEKCINYLKANPVTLYYELVTPIVTELGEHLALQTFAETTHITSDNYMLPVQKCKVPTNVPKLLVATMEENTRLKSDICELHDRVDEVCNHMNYMMAVTYPLLQDNEVI